MIKLSMIIALAGIIMVAAFASLIRALKRSVRGEEGPFGFIEEMDPPPNRSVRPQ